MIRKTIVFLQIILILMVLLACSTQYEVSPIDGGAATTEVESESTQLSEPESPKSFDLYDPIANAFMPYQEPLFQNDNSELMLTKEQVLEDYDYLWKMIEENIPCYSEISEYLGKNLNMVKSKHLKRIKGVSINHITATEYITLLNNALAEFNDVAHLRIISEVSFKNAVASNYQFNIDIERYPIIFQRLADIITNDKTEAFYQNIPSGVKTDTESIGLAEDEKNALIIDIFKNDYFMSEKKGIPYLRIKSFGKTAGFFHEYYDYAVEQLNAYLLQNIDSPHIIIDIRGNGGGSDGIWIEGIVPVLTSQELKFYASGGFRDSAYNDFLLADVSIGLPDAMPKETEFKYIISDIMTWNPPEQPKLFDGKIWLLVDGWVYSSSETLAVFCKQTGFATLVGSQTGGNGITPTPLFVFALPNSGALVYYQPTYTFNEDGTCNLLYGTKPDIDAGGRDALEVCLEEIAKLEN